MLRLFDAAIGLQAREATKIYFWCQSKFNLSSISGGWKQPRDALKSIDIEAKYWYHSTIAEKKKRTSLLSTEEMLSQVASGIINCIKTLSKETQGN